MTETELALQQVQPQEVAEFDDMYSNLIEFTQNKLVQGVDYDTLPQAKRKSLLKPGAEKIAFLFGLKPELDLVKDVENFEKGFFYYKYKCRLVHFNTGKFAGEAVRSCNSFEKKYLYGSVSANYATDEQKRLQVSTYKKGSYTYLRYKKPVDEMMDIVNTVDAMAQKRAVVAAVVQATMATAIFDVGEDIGEKPQDRVAPNAPVSRRSDPRRVKLNSRYRAVAAARGFVGSVGQEYAKRKYKVESFTNISTAQILELIEHMEITWKEVAKGSRPERIQNTKSTVPPQSPDPIEGEIVDTEDSEATPTIKYCYNKKAHKGAKFIISLERLKEKDDTNFCSDKCQKEYWGERGVEV